MIKKILGIIVVSILLSGNAFTSMNKIEKIGLLDEYLSDRPCNVNRESIETTTKYILSNSKLKITGDYNDSYLYIQHLKVGGSNPSPATNLLNKLIRF